MKRLWKKKKSSQEKFEKIFEKTARLQLRQTTFDREYQDQAALLEKKRNFGKEYVV
jgi:hypothetical protein